MQGLNTTPVHAHAALFGGYGLLALGLTLLVLRMITLNYWIFISTKRTMCSFAWQETICRRMIWLK
jgi:nitric oxide reductase large subunit